MNALARFLEPWTDHAYAALRAVSGLAFSLHGMQKIFGVLGKDPAEFGTQIWLGGLIELVAGLAIAAGIQTTIAAFLASGTMAVAYVQFHWKLEFGEKFFPLINKGELALVYSFLFLYLAARGGGRFSVDRGSSKSAAVR